MLVGVPGRLIARFGTAATLWRQTQSGAPNAWTQGTLASVFYPCRAAFRPARSYIIKGTLQEQSTSFWIDPASLTVPPQIGDRIALGTHTANAPGIEWHQITKQPELLRVAGGASVYKIEVSS